MKKRIVVSRMIIVVLMVTCLFEITTTSAEGVLPSLSETVGIAMPSLCETLQRYPDIETENEDGSVTELYSDVSETDFNDFSVYLESKEAELADYHVEGNLLTAEIRAKGASFNLSYDSKNEEAKVIYPSGTFDEMTKSAKSHFDAGQKLLEEGNADEALTEFLAIPFYNEYKPALDLLQNNEHLIAAAASASAVAREAKMETYRMPGNIVTFGCYEQDNNPANGKEEIQWIVLDYDEKEHKTLLLSLYGLDAKPYNTEYKETTWEECTLRNWLNGKFMQSAFSVEEQAAILKTNVDNSYSQGYSEWNTDGGADTEDHVFLLSYAEANRYLGITEDDKNNTKARVAPTSYAIAHDAFTNSKYQTADGEAAGWWWLRSPGLTRLTVAQVFMAGSLDHNHVIYDNCGCVRPALWLNIEEIPQQNEYTPVGALLQEDKNLAKTDHEAKSAAFRIIGSLVTFGRYEQDNSIENGPENIEWIVLDYDEKEHKTLLLSRYGLDAKPYNSQNEAVTWEQCTLRRWLNDEFLKTAFSTNEQAAILMTTVDNSISQGYNSYDMDGGENTQDQVFLLSYAETIHYLGLTFKRKNNIGAEIAPTAYAIAQGAVNSKDDLTTDGKASGCWLLRSPGYKRLYSIAIDSNDSRGEFDIDYECACIRPALWLDLEGDKETSQLTELTDAESTNDKQESGDQVWHDVPEMRWEFRIHDFDTDKVILELDIRDKENKEEVYKTTLEYTEMANLFKELEENGPVLLKTDYEVKDITKDADGFNFIWKYSYEFAGEERILNSNVSITMSE